MLFHAYTPYTSEVYGREKHALISKRLRYLISKLKGLFTPLSRAI